MSVGHFKCCLHIFYSKTLIFSRLKTVTFPLTGAVVGTCVGGPVGMLAGLKIGLVASVGCGVVGYGFGKIMKKFHFRQTEETDRNAASNEENTSPNVDKKDI